MKKLFSLILVLGLLWGGNAYAGLLDMFSKDHKYCGDAARSISKNKDTQETWYKECRLQLDLLGKFEWKMLYLKNDYFK